MQTAESLQEKSSFRPPIELRPLRKPYFFVASIVAFPALLWFVGISLGRKMPIEILYIPLGTALLMLAYMKNKTIRLAEAGITQGFSVFRTFMRYDEIANVRKETRFAKGATAVGLVVYKRNSLRRIVIPISSFDRTELGQLLHALRHVAPLARIEVDDLSVDA